jgi:hypothetical protein
MPTARGTFEVNLTPQEPDAITAGTSIGRMTLDKQFHGDLEGASRGQMLASLAAVEGSAGYVALEEVEGTLHGRRGSFVLQHSGTMDRGAPSLSVTVVPDSGTAELEGLRGTLQIVVEGGVHGYVLEYEL